MMSTNKPEVILCEGASELAYVKELGRLLYRADSIARSAPFIPRLIGNGYFLTVSKSYRKERKQNLRDTIWIWVDKDLYVRNDKDCADRYSTKAKGIPDFFFSEMNFEDFLILHCSEEIIREWLDFCYMHDHFHVPIHSEVYEPEFKKYFPDYKKGDLPFDLTRDRVETMMKNLESYPIKNDFGVYLSLLIKNGVLKFY